MTERLSELIKDYVEKVIEYEFASRERDEGGYTDSHPRERKAAEQAFIELDNYVKKVIEPCRKKTERHISRGA